MSYKAGDKIIRTAICGRGDKATIVCTIATDKIYKVEKADGRIQNWHSLHFKKDAIPEFIPEKDFGRKVGDVVVHTSFDSKPARIISTNITDKKYWSLTGVESGKPHRWKKEYCVLEGTKAMTPPKPVLASFTTVRDWKDAVIEWGKMWNAESTTKLGNNPFYNTNPSEEDNTMKLLIQDFTTINGVKSDNINTDGYIKLISDAEAEIERLEKLQAGSKAIRESKTIIAQIADLRKGVARCVSFLDADAS